MSVEPRTLNPMQAQPNTQKWLSEEDPVNALINKSSFRANTSIFSEQDMWATLFSLIILIKTASFPQDSKDSQIVSKKG